MRVAVVGGGLGGMAAAARLAKQGHAVTLLEAADRLGGALGLLTEGGFTWDAGAAHTLLPAALRDLFRKTGRPLETELERRGRVLEAASPGQQHRFRDGSSVDLPHGSRGEQVNALDAAFGAGAGAAWAAYTDEFAEAWDDLRRDWLEHVWSPEHASRAARRLLTRRATLARAAATALSDDRFREMAQSWAVLEGHDPREVPAWAGMTSYVEQKTGTWTIHGGLGVLAEVLADRLATRSVTVHTGVPVLDLVVAGDRVRGVRTADGDEPADAVVVAVDPRRLPALAPFVARTTPTLPPTVTHLGLDGEVPDLPHETVLHGDPFLVVRTTGPRAWTVLGRGRGSEDPVEALAARGIDVRDQVVVRVDRSPRDQVEQWRGSPFGFAWRDPRVLRRRRGHRLGTLTPLAGAYAAGAHTTPGAGVHYVALSAALVAEAVGPAR